MSLINWYVNTPVHQWFVNTVWKPSWTKFVTFVYGIPAMLVALTQYVSHLAGDDKVSTLLTQMHMPDGVFAALAGVAMITYIAHGRD